MPKYYLMKKNGDSMKVNYKFLFLIILSSEVFAVETPYYCKGQAAYSDVSMKKRDTRGDYVCRSREYSGQQTFSDKSEAVIMLPSSYCKQLETNCRKGAGGTGVGRVAIDGWFSVRLLDMSLTINGKTACRKASRGSPFGTGACDSYHGGTVVRLQCTFEPFRPDSGACAR